MLLLDIREILAEATHCSRISVYDLHCHITSYDVSEHNAPRRMLEEARKRGLTGLVQTEHDATPTLTDQITIHPGMERTTKEGHVNIVGPSGCRLDCLLTPDASAQPTVTELFTTLRDNYCHGDDAPLVVLPHPKSSKGLLRTINSIPEQLYRDNTPYLLEWANAHRLVTGKAVTETINSLDELNKHNRTGNCLGLVAGSDAHRSHDVALAGIGFINEELSWNEALLALREGRHFCYQIKRHRNKPSGDLFMQNAWGTNSWKCSVSSKNGTISFGKTLARRRNFKPYRP